LTLKYEDLFQYISSVLVTAILLRTVSKIQMADVKDILINYNELQCTCVVDMLECINNRKRNELQDATVYTP
jgi:hypothetical protein